MGRLLATQLTSDTNCDTVLNSLAELRCHAGTVAEQLESAIDLFDYTNAPRRNLDTICIVTGEIDKLTNHVQTVFMNRGMPIPAGIVADCDDLVSIGLRLTLNSSHVDSTNIKYARQKIAFIKREVCNLFEVVGSP